MAGGFVGVDVFFVISGFLITGLLLREHERTGRIGLLPFYARRARRLLPAALVVLIATLGASLPARGSARSAGGRRSTAPSSALSFGNIRFALAAGDYFSSVSAPSPFLHFWSLGVEEQFYLVWPALILLVARGGHARQRVAVALVVIVAASLAANLIVTDIASNWAFYSLPTRAWELGLGGLLAVGAGALARVPGRDRRARRLARPARGRSRDRGLRLEPGLPRGRGTPARPRHGRPGRRRLAGIGSGQAAVDPAGPIRGSSYSLYLVHWPILVLAPMAIGGPVDEIGSIGLVGASIVAAILCWALIETAVPHGPAKPGRPSRTDGLARTGGHARGRGRRGGSVARDGAGRGDRTARRHAVADRGGRRTVAG